MQVTLYDVSHKEMKSLKSIEIAARKAKAWNSSLVVRKNRYPLFVAYQIIDGNDAGNQTGFAASSLKIVNA